MRKFTDKELRVIKSKALRALTDEIEREKQDINKFKKIRKTRTGEDWRVYTIAIEQAEKTILEKEKISCKLETELETTYQNRKKANKDDNKIG